MTDFRLSAFLSLDTLPPSAAALLDRAGNAELFTSRPWFETFVAAGLSRGASPLFLVLADSHSKAHAILACQRLGPERGPGRPGAASLTSFYSCDFRPVTDLGPGAASIAFALGEAVAHYFAGEAAIRLDSLDPEVPEVAAFLRGLEKPGRALLRYAHFGQWWESVEGESFGAYFARRDGAVREVVRRKGRKMEAAGATFEMLGGDDIDQAIAGYEAVYANSWKEPEPFPSFQPTLMRKLADAGWLRLALCRMEGRPIAAQLWTVVAGRATVLKLAHDTALDRLSPGTVLTAFAIRTLIDRDGVAALDFGRGDDGYKRAWVANRTPHIGVLWASFARRPLVVARHRIMERIRGK